MFDGDVASGPVPHLFANNPREAKAALSSDSARAFRDLQRIWSKFFIPENLASGRSWGFLNNVRYHLLPVHPTQNTAKILSLFKQNNPNSKILLLSKQNNSNSK
jgi:hypothetical protein